MQTGRDLSRLDQGRRGFGGRSQGTERQNSAAAQYRSRQPAERAAGRGRGDLDSPKKRENNERSLREPVATASTLCAYFAAWISRERSGVVKAAASTPLVCVKKILLAHHPPSILHTSQQRSNGSSAIDLALQQVQRAGKHSWIQENSEREFQRKLFLLIPLSTA